MQSLRFENQRVISRGLGLLDVTLTDSIASTFFIQLHQEKPPSSLCYLNKSCALHVYSVFLVIIVSVGLRCSAPDMC
jgi:hypothetical protein